MIDGRFSKYRNSIDYLRSNKKHLIRITFLFLVFILIGFSYPVITEEILNIMKDMQKMFEGLNVWQTIGLIFFNNARTCLIAIISGVTIGVVPIMIALSNGYLIGVVSHIVTKETSILELWRLLPHGIFEIPAVLISLALGMKLGFDLIKVQTKKSFLGNLDKSLKVFILIVIPLLIVAALIEGFLIFFIK